MVIGTTRAEVGDLAPQNPWKSSPEIGQYYLLPSLIIVILALASPEFWPFNCNLDFYHYCL